MLLVVRHMLSALTPASLLQTPEPPNSAREVFGPLQGPVFLDYRNRRDRGVCRVGQRVETDSFRMLHPSFDERESIEHRSQMPRCLMLQGNQISSKLADGRM